LSHERRLTSGRVLVRSSVWSLLGQGLPLLIAVLAIPHLVKGLGIERFGMLTLAWLLVGYFGLFDLGLGWAVTRLVSQKLAEQNEHEIPSLVWTSQVLMLALGVGAALLLAALSPLLVRQALRVPPGLQVETLWAFYVLAISLPFVVGTSGLAGALAAHQQFSLLNMIRIPMGSFIYLGPLLVLPFSHSLVAVVGILIVGRALGWIAHLMACRHAVPGLASCWAVRLEMAGPLFRFGGWITVTNLVGPIIVYADRFMIGGMVSMASVAYYSTPIDVASRVWLVSSPVIAVLFPAFAASYVNDRPRTARLFQRGVQYAFLVLFPCALILGTMAHEGLQLWLGPVFAGHSTRVLQWIAVGVFLYGIAQVGIALVQGVGRPELTGWLYLVELPLHLGAMWYFIRRNGIEGAAVVWMARGVLEMVLLLVMSFRLLPRDSAALPTSLALAAASVALVVPIWIGPLVPRLVYLGLSLAVFAAVAWRYVVAPARAEAGGFAAILRPR
jgi:O-antigen/teichoic acid export membrane protein